MDTAFSIEESLRFGWQKTKENSLVLFEVVLTLFALEVVSAIIKSSLHGTALGALASLVVGVVGIVLGTGLLLITLKVARGEPVEYKQIVPPVEVVWSVFLASLLLGVLVFAGLILLIIPGIYFALRFSMVRYAVLDGAGVMESFEKSTKMTDGLKWQLLGFFAVVIVINIIGAILLMVGLLVTIPVTMIAMGQVYLKLKARAGEGHAAMAHTHEHHDHSHEGHDHSHDGHEHHGHTHEGNEHNHDHSDPNHTH